MRSGNGTKEYETVVRQPQSAGHIGFEFRFFDLFPAHTAKENAEIEVALGMSTAIPGIRYLNKMDIAETASGGRFG